MEKISLRVAAVSYTNTIPFIYGLQHYPASKVAHELMLLPPAQCAEAYYAGKTDMALVPVGAIRDMHEALICCNWCLGATGAVETVLLLSNNPLEELDTIYLDAESRTSNLLVQVLARHHWQVEPQFVKPNEVATPHHLPEAAGMVLIGDKTFGIKSRFRYSYDLAEVWHRFTGLPFVFACWLAADGVTPEQRKHFEEALAWGVQHVDDAIATLHNGVLPYEQVRQYLTESISFHFDESKREAITRFRAYCDTLP